MTVLENQENNTHLADKPILIDGSSLLTTRYSWDFCPHFLDILQHHIAMPVEGFDSRQELAVVATRDENLGVRTDSGLKDRQGPGGEFVFFK